MPDQSLHPAPNSHHLDDVIRTLEGFLRRARDRVVSFEEEGEIDRARDATSRLIAAMDAATAVARTIAPAL